MLAKDSVLMSTELAKLIEKGAIVLMVTPQPPQSFKGVPSTKEEWVSKTCISLKVLNHFVVCEHFKMEKIHLVQHLLQRGD